MKFMSLQPKCFLVWALSTLIVAPLGFVEETHANPKWELWQGDAKLRGAHMYQEVDWECEAKHGPWEPEITLEDLRLLRKQRANVVVFSIPGPNHIRHPWERLDSFIQMLDRLVNWAEEADLFAVISFRTGPGRSEHDITNRDCELQLRRLFYHEEEQAAFTEMWEFVADRYKARSHVIGYSLLVEPHADKDDVECDDENSEACLNAFRCRWRSLAQELICAVRCKDKYTPILVSPDQWSSPDSLRKWTTLDGCYLIYDIHQYTPNNFTQEKELIPNYSELEVAFEHINGWKKNLKGKIDTIAAMEFGVLQGKEESAAFLDKELRHLNEANVNNAVWIWEVMDDDWTHRDFDIRENPESYDLIRKHWKQNNVWPSNYDFAR